MRHNAASYQRLSRLRVLLVCGTPLFLFLIHTGACGSDGIAEPDASTIVPDDAARDCAIIRDLELPSRTDPVAYVAGEGTLLVWRFALNAEEPADYLEFGLYAGYGAMSEGIHTGIFDIVGDELNYGTCGLCITLLGDGQPMGGAVLTDNHYMVTTGRVVLESIEGRFAGELADMAFEHVDVDPDTLQSTPVGDGCTVSLSSLSFDVEIVVL